MIVLFWWSLFLLGFTYVGYPLCMALRARLHARPLHAGAACAQRVEVLLVVHDGARWLQAKLDNLLTLAWPAPPVCVHVALDGCNDASEEIAMATAARDPRVRVHAFPRRRGKSACIGDVLPCLDAPLVLFTDVRQRIDPDAVHKLAQALADPTVGAAGGELQVLDARGFVAGVDAYWRFEKWLRNCESRSGSVVGLSGALYMARREALPAVPAGVVLDDMWIPLHVAARGWRVVSVPGALAYDVAADSAPREDARKLRTLAGNVQLLRLWPRLAMPGGHPLWARLWGHKWLRLLAPWLLLLALAANLMLWNTHPFYELTLVAQASGYLMAALGALLPRSLRFAPIRLANAFVRLNLSAARAPFAQTRDGGHLWAVTRIQEGGK